MEVTVRILLIEDNPKHLDDARRYVQGLAGCTVDFATTLAEAMELLAVNSYDSAISDVFFPAEAGASADTCENAIAISATLVEMGIHHVFNTAGNHHGKKFQAFIWKTPKAVYNDDDASFLMTGMVMEAYPQEAEAEKDTKQWQAAFRYIFLVRALLELPDQGAEILRELSTVLCDFPYGEYGQTTDRFNRCDHPFVVGVFRQYNS